ncbi:MAG: hypothetical protein WBD40_11875 [Tepidisphaeraceae bacterium]
MGKFSGSLAAVLVMVFAGCGSSQSGSDTVERASHAPTSTLPAFERPRNEDDVLPRLAYESRYGDVTVDFDSSRRVRARTRRFRMWIMRGVEARLSVSVSGSEPSVVCLHLFDERDMPVAFQCAPAAEAAEPLRVFALLSGGAAGAPGLRAREVVLAGLAPSDASAVRVITRGGETKPVHVVDGGFLYLTRAWVREISFVRRDGA